MPVEGGIYEIMAGHNMVEASTQAGIDIVPCDIREMDHISQGSIYDITLKKKQEYRREGKIEKLNSTHQFVRLNSTYAVKQGGI